MAKRIFTLLCILIPSLALSQIDNGGFEATHKDGSPVNWNLGESGATIVPDAYKGGRAAKTWVWNYANITACYNVTENGSGAEMGSVISTTPGALSGYYKYEGEVDECGKAWIEVIVGSMNAEGQMDTAAYGKKKLRLRSKYKRFVVPLESMGDGTASRVLVRFWPTGQCHERGDADCCMLYIDDISLIDKAEEIKKAEEEASEEDMEESSEMSVGDDDGKKKNRPKREVQKEKKPKKAKEKKAKKDKSDATE